MVGAERVLSVIRSVQEKARRHVIAETRSTSIPNKWYIDTDLWYTPVLVVASEFPKRLGSGLGIEMSGLAEKGIQATRRGSGDRTAVGEVHLNSAQGSEE